MVLLLFLFSSISPLRSSKYFNLGNSYISHFNYFYYLVNLHPRLPFPTHQLLTLLTPLTLKL